MFHHRKHVHGSRLPSTGSLARVRCKSVMRRRPLIGGEADPRGDVLELSLLQHACCRTEPLEGRFGREVRHTGPDAHDVLMCEHIERGEKWRQSGQCIRNWPNTRPAPLGTRCGGLRRLVMLSGGPQNVVIRAMRVRRPRAHGERSRSSPASLPVGGNVGLIERRLLRNSRLARWRNRPPREEPSPTGALVRRLPLAAWALCPEWFPNML